MGNRFDVVVVGGGIVGLATATSIRARRPELAVAVLDKEPTVGSHQTGHNSGVVHSGVYYRPGSLKAELTLQGRRRMLDFAAAEKLPVGRIGKLIVATRAEEIPALDGILERGRQNGVDRLRRIERSELEERIPGLAGIGALEVPSAAITDYGAIARRLADQLTAGGAAVLVAHEVRGATDIDSGWRLATTAGDVEAGFVINCGGLEADRIAEAMHVRPPVSIVPFRGDFYRLSPRARLAVPTLVYPIPDPSVPFLGVHLTPTVHGEVLAGPNAALALAREGYHPGQMQLEQLWRMAALPGLVGLVRNYGGLAAREWLKSWSPAQFLDAVRSLWPAATESDLGERTSGVRAQAVRADGTMEDDFVLTRGPRALHVLNAPSPAATAAFAIGDHVAREAGFGGVSPPTAG